MKKLRQIGTALALAYVALAGALFAVMHYPSLFGKVMAKVPEPLMLAIPFKQLWFVARAGRLRVGDLAPDFTLPKSDKKANVRLSSFRGRKPVVLIFGSYT